MGQLGVDVVEDIPLSKKSQSDNGRTFQSLKKTYDVLQGSGTTEGEVLKFGQEGLSLIGFLLELFRVVDLFNMLLKILEVRD